MKTPSFVEIFIAHERKEEKIRCYQKNVFLSINNAHQICRRSSTHTHTHTHTPLLYKLLDSCMSGTIIAVVGYSACHIQVAII